MQRRSNAKIFARRCTRGVGTTPRRSFAARSQRRSRGPRVRLIPAISGRTFVTDHRFCSDRPSFWHRLRSPGMPASRSPCAPPLHAGRHPHPAEPPKMLPRTMPPDGNASSKERRFPPLWPAWRQPRNRCRWASPQRILGLLPFSFPLRYPLPAFAMTHRDESSCPLRNLS